MQRVQRCAAEDSGVKVSGACPDPDVEVDEPARREVEHRHPGPQHPAVVDDARVTAALVLHAHLPFVRHPEHEFIMP